MASNPRKARKSSLGIPLVLVAGVVVLAIIGRSHLTGGGAVAGALTSPESAAIPCAAQDPLCTENVSDPRNEDAVLAAAWSSDSLEAQVACVGKGYLCADETASGEVRVLRWPEEKSVLRIRVTRPDGVSSPDAEALRVAAIRGILSWQGVPKDFRILGEQEGGPADVVVEWTAQLPGVAVGQTRVEWERMGSDIRFTVKNFVLATQSPLDQRLGLTLDQIRFAAAHEMGHALGLPHSDDPRDVMYPENRARHLSVADYRTVQGLYELPNGAVILLTS